MIALRRFAVLCSLLFWQGGFTFYAVVVIPVGVRVLGSHLEQARITRHVSLWINAAGLCAVAFMLWDSLATPDPQRRRRQARLALLALMLAGLAFLAWLHQALDERFDPLARNVSDRGWFRAGHRWYLWASGIQWAAALGWLFFAVLAWRAADQGLAPQSDAQGTHAGRFRRDSQGGQG